MCWQETLENIKEEDCDLPTICGRDDNWYSTAGMQESTSGALWNEDAARATMKVKQERNDRGHQILEALNSYEALTPRHADWATRAAWERSATKTRLGYNMARGIAPAPYKEAAR